MLFGLKSLFSVENMTRKRGIELKDVLDNFAADNVTQIISGIQDDPMEMAASGSHQVAVKIL